ncbi:MAG: acetylglutamate kinase [Rhodobacteraceae bacterium]|nr:acetylglutamate kinase [Paracoccaceae bacterium]
MRKREHMKKNWIGTARTLSEALPYLQRYDDAVIVIKIGGNALRERRILDAFARDVVLMNQVGVNPVIVHGGGPMINDMLGRLGVASEFIGGKRVSNRHTVEVVELVLSGSINRQIVHAINRQGGRAVGLSGKDAGLMVCAYAAPELGFVGVPETVDISVLQALSGRNFIPVVAPLGVSKDGETLNINGDTAAGAIAAALKADRLLLLTDVDGVLDAEGKLLTQLSPEEIDALAQAGVLQGGMLPKTETAVKAVQSGVRAAVILNGKVPNAVLLELFTDHGAGSLIRA